LDIVLLVVSLAIILVAAELFTNGIEWLGHKLHLAEGAVGSVLAAVATAMPETLIPVIAILGPVISGSDPESSHAIKAAIEEARRADAEGSARVILFNLSGHGHFDLGAYDQYLAGQLEDFEYPREAVEASMAKLPKVG
jgi:tryptophan synthase beta chain